MPMRRGIYTKAFTLKALISRDSALATTSRHVFSQVMPKHLSWVSGEAFLVALHPLL